MQLNCKVIKKWQTPSFQGYPLFLAKTLVPPLPPTDSIFERSYFRNWHYFFKVNYRNTRTTKYDQISQETPERRH